MESLGGAMDGQKVKVTSQPSWTSAGLLLRLLRLHALTGAGGRAERLYAAGVFALSTVGVAFTGTFAFRLGLEMLPRVGAVRTAAITGFFGGIYVLTWLPLLFCFCGGRRRHWALQAAVREALGALITLPRYAEPLRALRREAGFLLALAAGLIVFIYASAVFFMVNIDDVPESKLIPPVLMRLSASTFVIYSTCGQLLPIKYVLTAVQLTSGLRYIATELRAASEDGAQLRPATLHRLTALYGRLSGTFSRLTGHMSAELTSTVAYGVVSNVSMWLMLVLSVQEGTLVSYLPMISLYVVGTAASVGLPCEVTQRALGAVGDIRDLLLAAEHRQPQLSQPLGLLRETACRDLERLGHLGLFRLERPLLLSVTATILTYIIVMVQFNGTGGTQSV